MNHVKRVPAVLVVAAALALGVGPRPASAQDGGPGGGEQDRAFVAECLVPSEKLVTIACVSVHLGLVLPRENAD